MDKTTLGDRMKNNYENISRYYLTRRMPVIIRIDGNVKNAPNIVYKYVNGRDLQNMNQVLSVTL